jgi:hypothetical protein
MNIESRPAARGQRHAGVNCKAATLVFLSSYAIRDDEIRIHGW